MRNMAGWRRKAGWRCRNCRPWNWPVRCASLPLAAIVYTDISRDGMMQGANVEAMAELAASVPLPIIASGGVSTLDDVRRLAALKLAGCIVGRALYEGSLKLAEIIAVASD